MHLGAELARQDIALVYGGAARGLMGLMADSALAGGGTVIGVITRALVDREVAHRDLSQLEVVETMHERKARMGELADAFVMLPGGFGTYEEFVEAVTWNELGIHSKPCGILNIDGFFDGLLALVARAVDDRFIRPEHALIVQTDVEPAPLLEALRAYEPGTIDKRLDPGQRGSPVVCPSRCSTTMWRTWSFSAMRS